ncbi:MAG: acyl-CoA thioesterase/bile acid-CoA:amino acid N-acyltransferase family protein [Lapillicoccus sp.]
MSRSVRLIALLAVAAALTACSSATTAQVTVSPADALFDTPFDTSVTGLAPHQQVTLQLNAKDGTGVDWSSSAVFTASSSGTVSTADAPVSGSYAKADRMGLVETLTPGREAQFAGNLPWTMTMSVVVDGSPRATATVTRQDPLSAGVRPTDVRPDTSKVYGTLFLPATTPTAPVPGVVVVGGSEGGDDTAVLKAALLAARGFPALALAYFHAPGLPDTLENVPLEYFVTGTGLLAQQPGVDKNRIVMWGSSRGSEAALLAAANFPDVVHAVIGSVPASEAFGGLPNGSLPAWTLGGKPVEPAPNSDFTEPDPGAPAAIPVERIRGPLLLICGGKDTIWPSCTNVDAIRQRLTQHSVTRTPTVLSYPDAGHYVGIALPYFPSTQMSGKTASGVQVSPGGTYQADAAGRADAWPKLLEFLHGLT